MKIRTSSWHFKLFQLSCRLVGGSRKTSLPIDGCDYLRRVAVSLICLPFVAALVLLAASIVFAVLLVLALIYLLFMSVLTLIYAASALLMLVFGGLPRKGVWRELVGIWNFQNMREYEIPGSSSPPDMWRFRGYEAWKIGSVPMYPAVVILACFLVWLLWNMVIVVMTLLTKPLLEHADSSLVVLDHRAAPYAYATIGFAVVLFFGKRLRLLLQSAAGAFKSAAGLAREYLRAKKEQYCPTIELIDDCAP